MFCANCGKQIKDGAKFCLYCGASQGAAPAPVAPPPRVAVQPPIQPQPVAVAVKPKKKKPVLAIVLVLLVLAAALTAAGYFVVLPMVHKKQWNASMELAGEYLEADDFRGAVRALEDAETQLPGQPETALQLARAYARSGDLDAAKQIMQQVSDARIQEKTLQEVGSWFNGNTFNADHMIMGESIVTNGEEEISRPYYSEPDDDTRRLSWWSAYADKSYLYVVRDFDRDWNCWKVVYYQEDGSVDSSYEYTYDTAGNCLSYTEYDGNDIMQVQETYTYDADGNKLSEARTNTDKENYSDYVRDFDTDGNCVKETYYNADGSVSSEYSYAYDEHGNCTEGYSQRPGENKQLDFTMQATYDDAGNLLERNVTVVNEFVYFVTPRTVFTYDAAGNKQTETAYHEDGTIGYTYTYDAQGIVVHSEQYDEDGNKQYTMDRSFENGYEIKATDWDETNGEVTAVHYYIDPEVLMAVDKQ